MQVMLFSDRLEVWNLGELPPALTLKSLLKPHGSYPHNPLIAEPLYLTKYIERMGTGIRDMVDRCRAAGLSDPEFKLTDGFVITIRRKPEQAFKAVGGKTEEIAGPESRQEDQVGTKFRDQVLTPLVIMGFISMTIPGKPTSSKQKYRLMSKGRNLIAKMARDENN